MQTANKNLMDTLTDIYEKEWVGQESLCVQVRGVGGTGVPLCSRGRSGWDSSHSVFRWEEWVGQESLCVQVGGVGGTVVPADQSY